MPDYLKAADAWEPIITSIENIERASGPNTVAAAEDFNVHEVKKYLVSVKKNIIRIEKSLAKVESNKRTDSLHKDLSLSAVATSTRKLSWLPGMAIIAGVGAITGFFYRYAVAPAMKKFFENRGRERILNGEVSEEQYVQMMKSNIRATYLKILSSDSVTPENKKKATEIMNKLSSVKKAKDFVRLFPEDAVKLQETANLFEYARQNGVR